MRTVLAALCSSLSRCVWVRLAFPGLANRGWSIRDVCSLFCWCHDSQSVSRCCVFLFAAFSYKTNHMELTNVSTTRRNVMLTQSLMDSPGRIMFPSEHIAKKVGIILLSETFPFLFLFWKVNNHLWPGGSVLLWKHFQFICQEYVTLSQSCQ